MKTNKANKVDRKARRLPEPQEHERLRASQLTELRKRIDEGLASLGRGEGVDGERFMAKLISDLVGQSAIT